MMKKNLICFLLVLFSFAVGCTHFGSYSVLDSSDSAQVEKKPIYYEFGDVIVPDDLKIDIKDSFVFQTPGYSAGVLTLKGSMELKTLIDFFNSNMAGEDWKKVASIRSPRSMLIYKKGNRWCVINISEKSFSIPSTYVEIWVAPSLENFQEKENLQENLQEK